MYLVESLKWTVDVQPNNVDAEERPWQTLYYYMHITKWDECATILESLIGLTTFDIIMTPQNKGSVSSSTLRLFISPAKLYKITL